MFKVLEVIKKHLIIAILISIISGVVIGGYFPSFVSDLKVLILPLTFLLVYPMMVTLKFHSLVEKMNVKLQVTTQIINFVVFPLLAFVIGYVFFKEEPYLRLGLLLISLLPTSGMTISWTVMAKGNVNAAIRMVVIGLLIGAIVSPFYISFLLGASVDVPVWDVILQILLVVFVPLVFAMITQYVLIHKYGKERFHTSIKKKFPLFSTLGVVLIIFVAISLKAQIIINNPMIIIDMLIPLVILYALYFVVSVLVSKLFSKQDAIGLVNGTLIRNLSLALAIVLSAFPEAKLTALLIGIAYALQVQIAAWNVKLTDRIYK
jgi:ACR3 family arsenite efflux pump ArsB